MPRGKTKDTKMVEVDIRFWTNGGDLSVNYYGDKLTACWSSGVVFLREKRSKGVKSTRCYFNRIEDIPLAIRELFRKNDIFTVESNRKGAIRGLTVKQ